MEDHKRRGLKMAALVGAMTVTSLVVGFVIGYFVITASAKPKDAIKQENHITVDNFVELLNASNIEENVRYFSSQPHMAGSERQKDLAEEIKKRWTDYGLDVDMPEYDVMLTASDENNPDYIEVVNDNGTILFNYTFITQAKADPADNKTWNIPQYYFDSASRHVQGGVLYVNKGRKEDFEHLKNLNISTCRGSIVLLKQSIGEKEQIDNAFNCEAVGVLIFASPSSNHTPSKENTYPNNVWLPKDFPIVHRLRQSVGDSLTPDLPAIKGTYRLDENETGIPVKLPIQLVNYSIAQELLKRLQGSKMPKEWKIESDDAEYRIGPFLSKNATLRLAVNTNTTMRKIYNVIGTVHGWDEPDHWVLTGNHRDAVSFGAADAVSGTAAMMEMSRGVGKLVKKGWKPRRTIKFCSWAAEEAGLLGSTEWVEENIEILRERAVAYINMDWLVHGNYTLKSKGNPMFTDLIFSQTKLVHDPNRPGQSIYSTWEKRRPSKKLPLYPEFITSGRGTDYQPFYEFAGVPSLDLQYLPKPLLTTNKRQSPYHTPYDTYHMAKMIDPKFKLHLAQAQLAARLVFNFTESPLLPFNLTYLAISLEKLITTTENLYGVLLNQQNITLGYIKEAAKHLQQAIERFEKLKASNMTGKERQRLMQMLNRRMVVLNKIFLAPVSFQRNPSVKNVLHGISTNKVYPDTSLPAISDAIEHAKTSGSWSVVKRQISLTNHCIVQARHALMIPVKS